MYAYDLYTNDNIYRIYIKSIRLECQVLHEYLSRGLIYNSNAHYIL